jgi:hypothetical protein
MIVALLKPEHEGYEDVVRQLRRQPRKARDGSIVVSLACHAPVAHWLGLPCIYIHPKPKWWRYPLVHERNVIKVLSHESVHCALANVAEDEDLTIVQRGFDRLFPNNGDLEAFLR